MIFHIFMKTADAVVDAIDGTIAIDSDITRDDAVDLCSIWFEFGERVLLEVDTEKKTCVVVEWDQSAVSNYTH